MHSAGCASQFVGQKSRKMGCAVCRNDFGGMFRNMFEKIFLTNFRISLKIFVVSDDKYLLQHKLE